jgi:hypothetical protein
MQGTAANFQNLPEIITMIIALSVASERLVEIVKGVWPWLDQAKSNPRSEARRKSAVQLLAVVAGIVVTALTWNLVGAVIAPGRAPFWSVLAVGLLASGGSGFWHTILGLVTSSRDLRRANVQEIQQETQVVGTIPRPTEGVLAP